MYKKGGGLFDFLGRPSSEGKKLNDRINKLLINIDYSEGKYTSNKSVENLIKWIADLHELDTIINNPNINKNSSGTKVILDKIKLRNNKMGEILINAAQSNNEEYMGLILAELPSLVNYTGKNRVTVLHIVARLGNSKFINLLLENGADIDAKMAGNLTPLHQAVISGDKKSIKALINAGANNSVVNERGHTARNLAEHGTVYNSVPSNFKKIRPLNTRRLPRVGINENLNNTNLPVSPRMGSSKRFRSQNNNVTRVGKIARTNAGPSGLPPLHSRQVRRNVSRGIASRNTNTNRFKKLENRFKALRATTTLSENRAKRIQSLTNRFKALRATTTLSENRAKQIQSLTNRFKALRTPGTGRTTASARRNLPPNLNTRTNSNTLINRAYNAIGIQRAHAPLSSNEELDAELANMAASNTTTSPVLTNKERREVNDEIANLNRIWRERTSTLP